MRPPDTRRTPGRRPRGSQIQQVSRLRIGSHGSTGPGPFSALDDVENELGALHVELDDLDYLALQLARLKDRRHVVDRRRAEVVEMIREAFPNGLPGDGGDESAHRS